MKPSSTVMLASLALAAILVASAGAVNGGGGGRRGGRGGRGQSGDPDELEIPAEEEDDDLILGGDGEERQQQQYGGAGPTPQTNTGYTIKKLFGESNSPANPTYPRKSAAGEVDNKTMHTYGAVPKAPQKIRLRGNRSDLNPNEGRVEVEHRGSWGLVCDGHFGDTEANVACKSLGFRSGANKYYSGSFFGTGRFRQKDILISQVRCSEQGDEADLNQCSHSHEGQCTLSSTAGVECRYNEGCPWGWFGYDGLCYQVRPIPMTPEAAATDCESVGASLAYILSEGENNFISNLLYTKYNNDISAVWTGGQFANIERRGRTKQAWVFKDSDHVIREGKTFWFPGFPDGSSARPTTDEEKRSCLALSKVFYRREASKDTEVNYFWWDNVSCKTPLRFICQRLAVSTECYNGTGKGYKGRATRTEDGSLCENWGSDNPDLLDRSSPVRGGSYGGRSGGGRRGPRSPGRLGRGQRMRGGWSNFEGSRSAGRRTYGYGGWDNLDHNYCRNADEDKKPWCWIDKKQSTMGYCNIRQCGNVTKASAGPPRPMNASFNSEFCRKPDQFFCPSMINYRPRCVGKVDVCDGYKDCVGGEDENATFCRSYKCKKEEFYCSKTHRCIPTWRVCDKTYDCDFGDDETADACKKYKPQGNTAADLLAKYTKSDNVDETASVPETLSTVTYFTLTLSQCQTKCDRPENELLASCAGFLFSAEGDYGSQCVLLPERLPSVTAGEASTFAYYEKKQQTCDTSTHFVCKNGHCVANAQKCNGYDDCGDFSDEIGPSGCPEPRPTFEVRLSSGKGTFEGRIEAKLFKEWGLVCDDGLDASLGDVVCKQLGFPQGHERLIFNAKREFGRGSGKFLMSSVNCSGVSGSLFDCPHSGWRSGNCSVNNVAGLVCRRQRACTLKEFRCSDRCVPLAAVCDGVADCPDGTDESAACREMTLSLRNSNKAANGVLEVSRGGISGVVCDDTFSDLEVQVACRHLGFAGRGRKLPANTYQASENAVMWVQDIRCKGTETSLFACNATNWGKTLCDVSEAVNIDCGLLTSIAPPPPPPPSTAAPYTTTAPPVSGCGQRFGRFPAGRIVNGYPAITGQFPWQVGIRLRQSSTDSQQWCGGTIINDRWIVTASHCFEDYPKSAYILRIGDLDNTVKEPLERDMDIDLLIKHERYSGSPAFDFDITLLRVKPDRQGYIIFNDAVQPACLPDKTLVAPKNTVCHVSGWGSMGTLDLPKNLMAANVPLIENAKCNELYAGRISERMQCAGFEAGGIDSCQGDSGGPLVCKVNDRYTLFGATSWGEGCALPGAPGVYANVRNLRDWIDQTIRSNP